MQLISKIALATSAVVLSACSSVTTPSMADLTAELNAFNDAFNERAAAYNETEFMKLYDKDTLWIMSPNPPIKGDEEPRKGIRLVIDNQGSLVHDIDHLFISEDGTQAVMIGTAFFEVEKRGMKGDGTYLFVMERENGDWKIVTDMFHQHQPQN